MATHVKSTGQEAEKKGFLNHLSRRTKIVGIAVLVFLVLLIVSIPGDQNALTVRQQRVEAAQTAFDLALPAVEPAMVSVAAYIGNTEEDLSENRLYTGLTGAQTTFNRDNATVASRFGSVVTFHTNVHSLLEGDNAVAELSTDEFQTLVAQMDTTLSVAWVSLMELNNATDEYNGYQSWISAKVASAVFGLPQGYPDPIPSNSRLTRSDLSQ